MHCESAFSINHDISKEAHSVSIIDGNSLKRSHVLFCYSQLLYNSKASLLLKDSLLHKVIYNFACALEMPYIPFQTAQELAQMKGRYVSTCSIHTSHVTRHTSHVTRHTPLIRVLLALLSPST